MPLQINFEFLLHRSFVANSVPPLFDSPVYLAQAQNMSHLGTSPPSGGQQSPTNSATQHTWFAILWNCWRLMMFWRSYDHRYRTVPASGWSNSRGLKPHAPYRLLFCCNFCVHRNLEWWWPQMKSHCLHQDGMEWFVVLDGVIRYETGFFVELEDKCWPECCGLRYNFPSRRQGRRLSGTSTLTPRFKSLRKGCNNVGFQTTGVWRSCEETTFSPQMSTLTSLDPKLLCEPLQS